MKKNEVIHNSESDIFYFLCPHCEILCQVPRSEIRCTIFRHAVFKDQMSFVPPHATKETCDSWLKNNLVYGCTKPFIFDGKTVQKCGYI